MHYDMNYYINHFNIHPNFIRSRIHHFFIFGRVEPFSLSTIRTFIRLLFLLSVSYQFYQFIFDSSSFHAFFKELALIV
jgi:hypothetical protein